MSNKVLSILFVITIFGFMLFSIIIPDKDISISERRKLAQFPYIEMKTIINGDFFEELNNYLVEQFPFRNLFRNIKGTVSNNIFHKKDESGVFIKDDAIYQLDSTLNEKSIDHFTNLLNTIQSEYIETDNVYFTVVPDKNYYLDDSIPKLDYQKLKLLLNKQLSNMQYINLFDTLSLDSYYKTDIHWKQEELGDVVNKLTQSMDLNTIDYPIESNIYPEFYGALYGRIANNLKPDKITYLSNKEINETKVYDYEKKEYRKVYEEEDLKNIDSYDIFLGGAKALLILENKTQTNGKELIMFRDSFGSSIAPLLISNYSKITLIDLRYLNSHMLDKISEVEFNKNQNILFIYSVPVINNSFTLK